MTRWLLLFLGGALLGGIVYLATIMTLLRTATHDAYLRLLPAAPVNAVAALPAPEPNAALMLFADPAFAVEVPIRSLARVAWCHRAGECQLYVSVILYAIRRPLLRDQ